jgi:hypothetical protein
LPAPDPEIVNQVFDWLVQGNAPHLVRDAIRHHWPGVNLDPIFDATDERFADASIVNPELLRGFCLEGYRMIFGKMIAIGDFAGAKGVLDRLWKISGGP